MYRFFVKKEQIDLVNNRVHITGSDVNHIKNVLRIKIGEEFSVSDGESGNEYRCAVLEFFEDSIECELRFIKEADVELPVRVHLYQGLPKADKMELIIQKAVELGVYSITPVETKRCIVKLDEKKASGKISRWQSIAEAAAKQSKRAIVPEIRNVISFKNALLEVKSFDNAIIPYEMAENMEKTRDILKTVKEGTDLAVFIGPEGGFDEEEIKAALDGNVYPVTLGKRILRTETAGMVVLAFIVYLFEQ